MATSKKPAILFVDDSPESLLLLRHMIRSLNVEVISALSGEEAIRKIKNKELFLALLDVSMPNISGLELAQIILKDKAHSLVPIIFITAYNDDDTIGQCYKVGGVDFILKPFQPTVLLSKVKIFLKLYNQKKELFESNQKLEQTEEDLRKSVKSLLELNIHHEEVKEEERRKIALDLHDDLGQILTAINMEVSWLGRNIPENNTSLKTKVSKVNGLLNEAILKVQKISAGLRPGMLDLLGLAAAIKWQVSEFKKNTGIGYYTRISPEFIDVDPAISINVFRIVQEALTNITRHSGATKMKLELIKMDDLIYLSISDNGRGIKKSEIENKHSFGLLGMKERIAACEGKIMISGKPGKGTNIKIHIPLNN